MNTCAHYHQHVHQSVYLWVCSFFQVGEEFKVNIHVWIYETWTAEKM